MDVKAAASGCTILKSIVYQNQKKRYIIMNKFVDTNNLDSEHSFIGTDDIFVFYLSVREVLVYGTNII